jgi:hypothetical protein
MKSKTFKGYLTKISEDYDQFLAAGNVEVISTALCNDGVRFVFIVTYKPK